MPQISAVEAGDVSHKIQRTFDDIRVKFDLPFVPSIFRDAAAYPDFFSVMWRDLEPVVASKEFSSASFALEEFTRSLVIEQGWRFSDQERALATQKFSSNDIELLNGVISTFVHGIPRVVLFSRLMQRGYSGGQKGRITASKHAGAISRMVQFQIPSEREAGLRVWLLYSDMRKRLGARTVPNFFRMISPYPSYLGSVWVDCRKLLQDPRFLRARDDLLRRSLSLLVGFPVADYQSKVSLSPAEWKAIGEMGDATVRLLPQYALLVTTWQRSFANYAGKYVAA